LSIADVVSPLLRKLLYGLVAFIMCLRGCLMGRSARYRRHVLKMGVVAVASLVWLIIKTGRKPSRVTYPCQKAAILNIHLFLIAVFAPLLDFGKLKTALPHIWSWQAAKTLLLAGSLVVAFGSITFTCNYSPILDKYLPVPLNLRARRALVIGSNSSLFFVQNASGFEVNMDTAVSRLVQLMEDHGLFFFNTTSHPYGLIGKDDVVLIKVNCQWPQRGGTNADLLKSLIKEILNHPEGFVGEIVVA